jgi:uncharacterized membrane protein YfcA
MSDPPSLAENDVAPSAAESDAAPSPAENYAVPGRTETSPESRTVETPPTTRTTGTPVVTTTAETGSSPGRLNGSLRTAQRSHRAGHWRRAWLQALAVLAAVVVGCGFGYVVARNDRPMQIFFSAAVATGLFLVFSAFATQLNRKRRRRHG